MSEPCYFSTRNDLIDNNILHYENSAIDINRSVSVDSNQSLNLKNADFIEPVIEFYYRINYNYIIPPKEEKLVEEEEKNSPEKVFYILDSSGKLRKIEFD